MVAQSQSAFGQNLEMTGHDFHAFLDAVNREIYLEHLIVLIEISIFGTRCWFSYRMEKNHKISPYRFIVPPLNNVEFKETFTTFLFNVFSISRLFIDQAIYYTWKKISNKPSHNLQHY